MRRPQAEWELMMFTRSYCVLPISATECNMREMRCAILSIETVMTSSHEYCPTKSTKRATVSTCFLSPQYQRISSSNSSINTSTQRISSINFSTIAQGPVLAFSISYAALCAHSTLWKLLCGGSRIKGYYLQRECVWGAECSVNNTPKGFDFVAQERVVKTLLLCTLHYR